ncbi:MAG: S-adenosylmethionine:tRNA ribosyltransferase-isomerase [Bacteroidales bacterium]|jgi:S-adenosylmethionine:tRNA ribosyltransferase-isomerase|nr:S-adenosylmethionine:tRNA ribosyltransferase-isomerase [Bacteroidales bacterium]
MLNISINDYNYQLPDEKIALYPAAERDNSKLLIWNKGVISETIFKNIDTVLPKNALLVFNDTRVVPARLVFTNNNGARIEIFFLEPHEPKETVSFFAAREKVTIKCLIGNKKRWKGGMLTLQLPNNITLSATLNTGIQDTFLVSLSWNNPTLTFSQILELAGKIPLPPYINRDTDSKDRERYQTVFARYDGSVAAPTAGLHFTNELLQQLQRGQNIEAVYLTLHVGAGTFKPVKADNISEHEMHAEKFSITAAALEQIKNALRDKRPIIPVGTTSMRTLESLYYLAYCLKSSGNCGSGSSNSSSSSSNSSNITQWMPYEKAYTHTPLEAIEELLNKAGGNYPHQENELHAATSLMIAPSYKFHFATGIITNFHQPKSTLLLLVAAMLDKEWQTVYNYALENNFRFLSYGDSNLYLM